MDDDVSAALDSLKESMFELTKETVQLAQDENAKKFDDAKTATDDLTEKVTEMSNKLEDLSQKVTAIQDYLRSLAPALISSPPGGPIIVSPPPW